MPKPDRIPTRKRRSIIGSFRGKIDDPSFDAKLKKEIIRLSTFENQKDLYEQQLKEMRDAQQQAFKNAQDEIDKIQIEFQKVQGGVFYVEDTILTRHYYLEDQANSNPGNPGNPGGPKK